MSECSSDHTSSCPNTLCTASAGGNGTTANSTDPGTDNLLDCTFNELGSTELEFSIEVLSWTSMAVLTIFMAENILHIFTLGCQFFSKDLPAVPHPRTLPSTPCPILDMAARAV